MNPFDQPPTEPPVSLDPPGAAASGGHDGPRRGRMALAALAAAGLVGGGIVVAGQFASADRPSLDAAETVDAPAPEQSGDDEPAPSDGDGRDGELPSIDGEIVIDDGDGQPLVLDLGRIAECLGPIFGGHEWSAEGLPPMPFDEQFEERMQDFLDELPMDELEGLDDGVRIFGSGGSTITVVGPDGVEIIDLGEGDATVTIEQSDGELTIETDGDATVAELPDVGQLLPGLGELDLGELDLGELDLGELDLGELDLEDWSGQLPFDPGAIGSCLDELGGTGPDGS